MRPISFSGMEDAITVQKPNGTHVSYHMEKRTSSV